MEDKKIGKNLFFLRKKLGVPQSTVAEQCGISLGSYNHYEKSNRIPDAMVLKRFARFFDVSMDWLVTGEETTYGEAPGVAKKDRKILQEIIVAVEDCLEENDLEMPSHKKAEMIFWLYDEHLKKQETLEEVKQSTSNVIRLMVG